jgi:DnaK suppressor protein
MPVKTQKNANANAYRTLLVTKRDELSALARKDPEALSTSLQPGDEGEFAARAAELDVSAATADLRSEMLKEINDALKRVARGSYGECEGCGQEVSPNRLKAIPWARYCLICQELRLRN